MNWIIKLIFDLLFLTRPLLLIPVWGFSAFGYKCGLHHLGKPGTLLSFTVPISVYSGIFVFSLSVASVYILNQIADIEVDKKNGGLPLLASGVVTIKSAWITAIVLFGLSVVIPLMTGTMSLALLSTATILIGILYSFKPTFFSGRPVLDFISNALGYGVIAFGTGWYLSGNTFTNLFPFIKASAPYVLLMCAGSISSTLPDRSGDLEVGKNTTAVVFGNKTANVLATIILLLSLICSLIEHDAIALLCTIIPLPLYVAYILKPGQFFMESTYKVGGGLTMVCASLILPAILIIGTIVFISTRLYFRLRHRVHYPSLLPIK
jgi:4-hydroxybenzoate polyprenyltransferase